MMVYLYPARYLHLVSASTLCSKTDFWLVVSPWAIVVFQMLLWHAALCGSKTKQDAAAKNVFQPVVVRADGGLCWLVVTFGCTAFA